MGRHSIAAAIAQRRIGERTTVETRYYLSRLPADPVHIGQAVRAHWGSQTGGNGVLDVAVREDESRVRSGHAAENLAVVRHVALTLLRREPIVTVGITAKRRKGGWDETCLANVLAA